MSQIIYKLVMQKGPTPGEEFILDRPEVVMGRDIKNEVTINDAEISRHHARLIFKDETFVVQDMGSTNGVFVDEQRISGLQPLMDGAKIRMGDNVVLQYMVVMPVFDQTLESQAKPAAPRQQEPVVRPAQTSAPRRQQPAARTASPTPEKPAQRPAAARRSAPVKEQGYAGHVPDSPPSQVLESPFDMRMLGIGCGAILVVFAIILILVLMYIDRNMLWCEWLGWLMPQRCPLG